MLRTHFRACALLTQCHSPCPLGHGHEPFPNVLWFGQRRGQVPSHLTTAMLYGPGSSTPYLQSNLFKNKRVTLKRNSVILKRFLSSEKTARKPFVLRPAAAALSSWWGCSPDTEISPDNGTVTPLRSFFTMNTNSCHF